MRKDLKRDVILRTKIYTLIYYYFNSRYSISDVPYTPKDLKHPLILLSKTSSRLPNHNRNPQTPPEHSHSFRRHLRKVSNRTIQNTIERLTFPTALPGFTFPVPTAAALSLSRPWGNLYTAGLPSPSSRTRMARDLCSKGKLCWDARRQTLNGRLLRGKEGRGRVWRAPCR